MKIEDFCYTHQGKHVAHLKNEDALLLQSVEKRGTKTQKALLILHGFSSSPAVYRNFIHQIKQYDTLICPILPGHAQSIEIFSQSSATEWLEASTVLCEELLATHEQVDVLGLSLGGLLALFLSQLMPLHHLYLLAPAIKLQQNSQWMLQLVKVLQGLGFQHIRNAAGNLLNEEQAEITYRKLPLQVVREIYELIHSYQWIPPTCPVDVFLGEQDRVVANNEIAALFNPLPNATIHWLKNSAHVLPLDNDVGEIIRCVNGIT